MIGSVKLTYLGPRPSLVWVVRVSAVITRKTMGAIGLGHCELEVTHRKAFTLTVGSFSGCGTLSMSPSKNA